MKNRVLTVLFAAIAVVGLLPATALANDVSADTVVYGTIRTAEAENPVAEAIAIKDGKFIYVGDEVGAAAYMKDGVTEIIDHRGRGMVMPGCTDGHSHYTMKFGMENMKGGLMFAIEDDRAAILQKLDAATLAAKKAGKQSLFGFGWSFSVLMADPLTLEELDNVTHGVSTIIFDQGGHHAFCNSECLKRSGIIDGNGGVLIKEIDGGYLALDEKGYPTGYAEERVTGYMMRMGGIDQNEILDDQLAETSILITQDLLLSTGYTMALDGWSNMFHPNKLYAAANRLDKEGKLSIVFPMTYEVEPWQTDINKEIDYLDALNKTYGTNHVLPKYLKLFMDGVVETKTGALLKPYKAGTEYKSFWSVDRLADITSKCNAKDLTVHIHAMGDAAIKDVTDAYIQGGDGTHRNCMVHLRNVRPEDFKRFADNNIACSAGITWHIANGDEGDAYFAEFLEPEYIYQAYPIKSFFDAGVKVSSHSDYPANKPCPQDPFGIMEIAVTGQMKNPAAENMLPPYDKDELITIEQAFQALTINGAWQLGLENERGSIKVGKWADFVLADKDVFTCKASDIGETKVVSTWFEGKQVYAAAYDESAAAFADSRSCSPWAESYIRTAEEMDILPDRLKEGAFTAKITREEFAELSVKLYEKLSNQKTEADAGTIRFADCENPEIIKAVSLGITNGISADSFAPKSNLTRAQGATMLTRVYKKHTFTSWSLDTDAEFENEFINSFRIPPQFDDAGGFDPWATTSIAFMRARSIIDGVGNNLFNPKGYLTREQAVKIAVKMLAVIDNPSFAPADAFFVDSNSGSSLYTWVENGQTVIALYDTDGNLTKSFRTEAQNEVYYEQLCRTDYSRFGWYSGLAGLYRIQDGDLVQFSSRPVKDLLFVRLAAGDSGPIILTWSDDTDISSIQMPADTIVNVDCDGQEVVLLSADDGHGIEIAGLDAEDSVIAFYTENIVGMGHYDSYRYVLLSAPGGVPSPNGGGKNIFVTDFTAGRPEVMEGFGWDAPEGYKAVYIAKERQRLNALSLAH